MPAPNSDLLQFNPAPSELNDSITDIKVGRISLLEYKFPHKKQVVHFPQVMNRPWLRVTGI